MSSMTTFVPFPDTFPNKGKFRVYSSNWNPIGWGDLPTYPGQQPLRFPEDATPFECFIGCYLRPAPREETCT